MKIPFACLLVLFWCSTPARAETIVCPEPARAVQVGACPSEEELQFTFSGYCSDNARVYDKPEDQLCTDYQLYRAMKNFSLWETPDGRFSGYVSCEPGKSGRESARVTGLKLDKQGSVTRMTCRYSTGVAFTYRTKSRCSADVAACADDPAACKAECE